MASPAGHVPGPDPQAEVGDHPVALPPCSDERHGEITRPQRQLEEGDDVERELLGIGPRVGGDREDHHTADQCRRVGDQQPEPGIAEAPPHRARVGHVRRARHRRRSVSAPSRDPGVGAAQRSSGGARGAEHRLDHCDPSVVQLPALGCREPIRVAGAEVMVRRVHLEGETIEADHARVVVVRERGGGPFTATGARAESVHGHKRYAPDRPWRWMLGPVPWVTMNIEAAGCGRSSGTRALGGPDIPPTEEGPAA